MKIEDIKFKAKRLDGKGWAIGDLLHSYENGAIIVPIEGGGAFSVDPSSICQFTGLKDCNGNEVWEGDVIKSPYFGIEHTIEWNNHLCSFNALDEIRSSQNPLGTLIMSFGWYVVGNKFEKEK